MAGPALKARQREWVNVELHDAVTGANQPDELALGGSQCRVRHHVQKADMQFTDVLVNGLVGIQQVVTLSLQVLESGQVVVGDDGHARSVA